MLHVASSFDYKGRKPKLRNAHSQVSFCNQNTGCGLRCRMLLVHAIENVQVVWLSVRRLAFSEGLRDEGPKGAKCSNSIAMNKLFGERGHTLEA